MRGSPLVSSVRADSGVWVSENTFSAFLIHYQSTQNYPPRFCSGEHAAGVGVEWWFYVERGEIPDYRLEIATWEEGKGGRRGYGWCGRLLGSRVGRQLCWKFWLTLQGERRRTEKRHAGSTWPWEGAAPWQRERSGAEEGSQAAVVGTRSIPHLAQHSRLARCTAAQSVQIPFKVEILVFPLSSRCRSS